MTSGIQFDLKAAFGLNGLDDSPWSAWDDIQMRNFPSWSVGVQMRIPVLGGIKTRAELEAARLRLEERGAVVSTPVPTGGRPRVISRTTASVESSESAESQVGGGEP